MFLRPEQGRDRWLVGPVEDRPKPVRLLLTGSRLSAVATRGIPGSEPVQERRRRDNRVAGGSKKAIATASPGTAIRVASEI